MAQNKDVLQQDFNAKYKRKIVVLLKNEGSAGATSLAKLGIDYMKNYHPEKKIAIFSGDENNMELHNSYGTRDKKGKLIPFRRTENDPLDMVVQSAKDGGVEYLDFLSHNGALAKAFGLSKNSAGEDIWLTFIDLPAVAIKAFVTTYGKPESMIRLMEKANAKFEFVIPVITKDKSIQGIIQLHDFFADTAGPLSFNLVKIDPLVGNDKLIHSLFHTHDVIKSLEEKQYVNKFTITTELNTEHLKEFVKISPIRIGQDLNRDALPEEEELLNAEIVIEDLSAETDAIWNKILF